MKKSLLITIAIVSCLVSCSRILTDAPATCKVANETKTFQGSVIIIPETEGLVSFDVDEVDIRSFVKRVEKDRRISEIEPIRRENKPLVYVVNYDRGWAVFSSDKHLPPILAENPEGSFDVKRLDNPGVVEWLDGIMEATKMARQEGTISMANEYTMLWEGKNNVAQIEKISKELRPSLYQPNNTKYTWTKILVGQETEYGTIDDTGALLSTNWGQEFPWWNSLPIYTGDRHYYTGCVAVALSQLLYYYHYSIGVPSGLYHSIGITGWNLYQDKGSYYYKSSLSRLDYMSPSNRWDQMITSSAGYSSINPACVAGAEYVSDLMVDVGNRVDMRYYADASGSGSSIDKAYSALPSFGLTATQGTFNSYLVNYDISCQRPVYVRGVKQNAGGHAWVIDGYRRHNYTVRNVYEWWIGYSTSVVDGEGKTYEDAREAAIAEGYERPEDGMITRELAYNGAYYTYHMNWGWDGLYNGYFTEFTDTQGYSMDRKMLYEFRAN